jgi:pimeloyl-ACP methyl ester carboxylesterase
VAGIVAAQTDKTDFVVMLAGPGIDGATLYRHQIETILRAEKYNPAKLNSKLANMDNIIKIIVQHDINKDISAQLLPAVADYMRIDMPALPDNAIAKTVADYNQPWFRAFLKLRPARDFANIDVPVLALAGEYDLQVLPEENTAGIKAAIDDKKMGAPSRVTTKILPSLNHLFQTGITGHPAEYGTIHETFSPAALEALVLWLEKNTGVK